MGASEGQTPETERGRSWRRTRLAGTSIAALGGVLLIAGPFVRWVSVTADGGLLMRILHEGAHAVSPIVRGTTASLTWLEAGGGAGTVLAIGIAILVLAVIGPRRRWFPALIVAGGIGAGVLALTHTPNHRAFEEQAVEVASPWAFAVHVEPDAMRPAFAVDQGPSIAVCVAGAGLAVLGGVILLIGPGTPFDADGWVPWTELHPAEEA